MSQGDGYFVAEIAAAYDAASAEMFGADVVDPAVDVLADLAGDGRALEFGIGTGRIALPLARRGVEVHGVDLSQASPTPASRASSRSYAWYSTRSATS